MTAYNLTVSDSLSGTQQGVTNVGWHQSSGDAAITSYTYDLCNLIWSVETRS